jgi:type II secretory pathway pseudopilin PulG
MVNNKFCRTIANIIHNRWRRSRAQTMVEILVAIGIAGIILPALAASIISSREGRFQKQQRIEAASIMKETMDTVRIVRELNWDTFAVNGTFHPVISGNTWTLAAGPETIGGYTRQVTISDTYRYPNLSGDISQTGVLDPSTKKLDFTVSWNQPLPRSMQSTTYLTRYLDSQYYTDTTQTQTNAVSRTYPFNAGTQSGVTVRASSPPAVPDDGEVILGSGGHGNWCAPSLLTAGSTVNGQGSQKSMYAFSGGAAGTSNQVFFGAGGNASGDSLDHIFVSDPQPTGTPVSSVADTYNKWKSYGIFGDTNYAYLTSDHTGWTLDVVRITSTPYVSAGHGDGNGANGVSVFVADNRAYVTASDSKLYTFDVPSVVSGTTTPLANTSLGAVGNKIIVVNSFAFIATNSTTNQLQIVQIFNNGTSFGTPINISLGNSQPAKDLYVNATGTRAYVVTNANTTTGKSEFFIVNTDITSPGYKSIIGSYDTKATGDMNPAGVTIQPGNIAIIGGSGGETYQVLNINDETSPVRCGGLTLPSGYAINALSSILEADGDAYSYLLTSDSSKEFKIIEGGSGGAVSSSGVYESATFDTSVSSANNRFTPTFTTPANTVVQFQVSMANKVSGSCPATGGYTFVGFDGSMATKSTLTSGQSYTFPFSVAYNYANPGQCVRYKAYLESTDGTSTPVLNDVTINFSP